MTNNIVDNIEQCCPNNTVAFCFQQLLLFGRAADNSISYLHVEPATFIFIYESCLFSLLEIYSRTIIISVFVFVL